MRLRRGSANVLTLLSRDLTANLNALDTTLKGIVQELADDDLWQSIPHLRHRILFGHLTPAETGAGDILVINEYGRIIEDAASEIPRGGSFTDRDYFQFHRDRSDAGLHVSRPFKSRLDDGLHIALSRRVSRPGRKLRGRGGGGHAPDEPLASPEGPEPRREGIRDAVSRRRHRARAQALQRGRRRPRPEPDRRTSSATCRRAPAISTVSRPSTGSSATTPSGTSKTCR